MTRYFRNEMSYADAKAHYRKLAKQLHPDAGGSKQEFTELANQYQTHLQLIENGEIHQDEPINQSEIKNELENIINILVDLDIPQKFLRKAMQNTTPAQQSIIKLGLGILSKL